MTARSAAAAGLRERIKALPLVRDWRRRRAVAHFLSKEGFASCYGVFADFGEARRFLPPNKEFDDEALARMYVDQRLDRIFGYDYPVIHWMGEAFRNGSTRVFDIGGSVGVHFYAYRRYLGYPSSLAWEVYETPAVVRMGREMAARERAVALTFTQELEPASVHADIWISAGAIHYLEHWRPNLLLGACRDKPEHVILNKLPLYEGDDFVTSQNLIEGAFAPHHVYNRGRFIADIEGAGYALMDSWEVPERALRIPDHPERSIPHFTGLCFRRR